jgi:hypothetical protein
MANFCLATGIQPSEYKQLDMVEREAVRRESERLAQKMKGR